MLRGKGFLRNIFANGVQNPDETSPDVAPSNASALLDKLKSEYGIEITPNDMSSEELMKNGYRKMTANEVAKASMVLQYIPQLAASAANNNAFMQATNGMFKVRIPDGAHLAKSLETPGAYRAMAFANDGNKLVGNAELFPVDGALSINSAPQIALGLFSAISFATGSTS